MDLLFCSPATCGGPGIIHGRHRNRLGELRDVTLYISVELFSKVKNPIPNATRRDALFQR
jgi:hypothetical protein